MELLDGFSVTLVRSKPTHVWHKGMKNVITALKSINIQPEWKTPEEILDMSLTSKTVLVMADFNCDFFSNFAESSCLVVGPDCLNECIANKVSIPANCSPVYNMAMTDLVITCTNMPKKKKEEMKKYIGWMGGCYTNTFTLAHTHLIADTVNSEKCHAAAEKRRPIMSSNWVMKIWEASLDDPKLRADNEDIISMYRLPPFKGLEITLSKLSSALKMKYKKLIEENGGICTGSLTQKQTHFVVSVKCEGDKVKSALAWGDVHVVTPLWIEKSIDVQGPLPPKDFSFKQRPTCSTPTSELPSFMSAADISVVGGPNNSAGSSHIDETLSTTVQSIASYVPLSKPIAIKHPPIGTVPVVPPSPAPEQAKSQPIVSDYDKYKKIIEDIKLADVSKAGSFLDGCKIYLCGWAGSESDKLRRLLIKGGSTVLTKVSRGVTHIVAAELPPDHATLTSVCLKVVSVEWVKASLEEGQPVDVSPYLLASITPAKAPPPSPLSNKGLELLKYKGKLTQENGENPSDHAFQPPVSRKLFEKTPKKRLLSSMTEQDGNISVNMANLDEPPEPSSSGRPTASQTEKLHNLTNSQRSTTSDITNTRAFQGLVFVVLGFDTATAAEIVKVIDSQGGSVVPSSFQGVPDYAVVPLEGAPDKLNAPEVVNALWIEDCLDQHCLVDIQYYHQPVSIRAPGVSLRSAVICLSGFLPKEKIFLSNLASLLGATVQDAFSRKDNPAKEVLRCTHLVSNEPSGSKYEAAIKWGIPAVSKAWLLEAVAKSADNSPPPLDPFFLSKIQPDQDAIVETTPLTCKSMKSNCSVTPIENKRGSQLTKPLTQTSTAASKRAQANSNSVPCAIPLEETPVQTNNQTHGSVNENHTPVSTKSISISKEFRANASMFPSPGDEAGKFNVSIPASGSMGGLKRKSGDRSPPRAQNSPATPLFITPQNVHGKLAKMSESILDDGKSPFHVDTPDTPLGRVFYSNPDKKTTKMYKKFIDSFPDFKPETPPMQPKKASPPVHVLRKQILAQLGADVSGIEKGTGKLLKDGIYSEWANISTDSSYSSPAVGQESNGKMIVEETPICSRKSPGLERRKSSNDKVNELRNLMAEIQKSSETGESQDDADQRMEQRILERLQAEPIQEQKDIKSHPLNKIRPNSENLFDAERPSTSSLDKEIIVSRTEAIITEAADRSSRTNPIEDNDPQMDDEGTPTQPVPKRFFMLSSLPADSKEMYEGLIKGLGGEVSTASIYEEESTHLVMETPVRNEKLLCSVASGKWVLHTSYLDQCYERRCFIPEEAYEWGNPLSGARLPKLENGSQKEDLAKAAYKWRKSCSNLNQRAFKHMKAHIICREQTKAMFTRVLLAGGAQILDDSNKCNICLVEEGKVELENSFLELLAKKSVACVPLIYLSLYLTKHPRINPNDYLIQQYLPIFKKK